MERGIERGKKQRYLSGGVTRQKGHKDFSYSYKVKSL